LPTGVAVATKSPNARRLGVFITPAKYEADRTTGGKVMGIFANCAISRRDRDF